MDAYTAVMIVEGVETPESEEQFLEAAQVLVNTGLAWVLQGSFGRLCQSLIDQGLIQAKE